MTDCFFVKMNIRKHGNRNNDVGTMTEGSKGRHKTNREDKISFDIRRLKTHKRRSKKERAVEYDSKKKQ